MTEFNDWALSWYNKNEKIEKLKSHNLEASEKRDRIKTIRREVVKRLNLVLDTNLSDSIEQEIGVGRLYSAQDEWESSCVRNEKQKKEIENALRRLKEKLNKWWDKEDICAEYAQIEQNKKQIEALESSEEDMDNILIKGWIEIDLLLDEYSKNIQELQKCIDELDETKVTDGDIKGEEKQRKKLNEMEQEMKYHKNKYKAYYENPCGTIECFNNINDDEIKLFEVLLSHIRKEDISSLKKDMWEKLKLEVREQIIELLDMIIQDEENPNRKIWSQCIVIEKIEEYLLHPAEYRINRKMNLISLHLKHKEDIEVNEYLECLPKVEKYLTKSLTSLERLWDKQASGCCIEDVIKEMQAEYSKKIAAYHIGHSS